MKQKPEIIQLPWDQPILSSAVDWLLADQTEGCVDLTNFWLLLPTRQSGRRLRDALTWACRDRGGLFLPRTGTPFQLLQQSTTSDIAPKVACLGHWTRVLQEPVVEQCPSLFPSLPDNRDFSWRRKMAGMLHDLRGALVEGDWSYAEVAASKICEEEPARWHDLARLESIYLQRLKQFGLMDLHDSQRTAARNPESHGMQRVVLLGVTDATPLVQLALEGLLDSGLKVQVVIFGPAEGFDEWGRPTTDYWKERELPFGNEVILPPAQDEKGQAEVVLECVEPYKKQRHERVAVGVVDPGLLPHLERVFAEVNIPAFNPDGKTIRSTPLFVFLNTLHGLLLNQSFAQAAAFLRLPDIWGWAVHGSSELDATKLLGGLDELHKVHLPATLEDATRLQIKPSRGSNRVAARDVLRRLSKKLNEIESSPLSCGLTEFMQTVFAMNEFREGNEMDQSYIETATYFMERLREWESSAGEPTSVRPAEALGVLLDAVGAEVIFQERNGDAVEIQGWMELAWDDVPHLVVSGCNEGHLPKSVVGDQFLPESLRERLGLVTNDNRLARDIYLMELLHTTRGKGGRVDIILGRQRMNGDPQKPSRILLRCSDDQLPDRVKHLFRKIPPEAQSPAWSLPSWALKPRAVESLQSMRVTAFKSYLRCPFRFYLEHALKMESVNTSKRELDALDFGSLIHLVVEDFGRDESARTLTDAGDIHNYLVDRLRELIVKRYGASPPLPVQMQQEIAERRLYSAAIVQASEFEAGWRIIDTECKIEETLGGMKVRGRIDRVERNENTNALRVLDYKTSAESKTPLKVHTAESQDHSPEYAAVVATIGDKEKSLVWTDLQLPLYAWSTPHENYSELQLGYFNLPSLGAKTGVQLLEPYTPQMHEAAINCATAIVERVQMGVFWPPSDKVQYDEFKGILFERALKVAEAPKWEGSK